MDIQIQPSDLFPGVVTLRTSDDEPGYMYVEFLQANGNVSLKVSTPITDKASLLALLQVAEAVT